MRSARRGGCRPPRGRAKCAQGFFHRGHTDRQIGGARLNAQFVLPGELDVLVFLHHLDDAHRVDRRVGDELQTDDRFSGIDFRNAERFRGQPQTMRFDQRVGLRWQFAETVDQFFLDAVDRIVMFAVCEALVER